MRIDYKVLWIEDTLPWLEPILENIKDYLNEQGFNLVCDNIEKYEEKDFSSYDIIVIDYNLSDEEKGIEAVNIIRNQEGIFTDILFYSMSGESTLRKEITNKGIDGVYCAGRENCEEKLKKLIYTTIRKTQEINNLRGLVMSETSRLDSLIRSVLQKNNWEDKHSEGLINALVTRNEDNIYKLKSYKPPFEMNLLINEHFDATFAFQSLKEIIPKENWNEIKTYKEVLETRNLLAHGREISSSSSKIVLEKRKRDGTLENIVFTSETFLTLRKEIKKYHEGFNKLL